MVATALIFVTPLGTFYRSRRVQKSKSRLWAENGVWKLCYKHCDREECFATLLALQLAVVR